MSGVPTVLRHETATRSQRKATELEVAFAIRLLLAKTYR